MSLIYYMYSFSNVHLFSHTYLSKLIKFRMCSAAILRWPIILKFLYDLYLVKLYPDLKNHYSATNRFLLNQQDSSWLRVK